VAAAHRPFDPATMTEPQSIDELVAAVQETARNDDHRVQAVGAALAGAAEQALPPEGCARRGPRGPVLGEPGGAVGRCEGGP
jgi:hypothetical protein